MIAEKHRVKNNLQTLLEQRGMNAYRLNKLTGIDFKTIRNLVENKTDRISFLVVTKLCDALDCTVADLLYLEDTNMN